MKTPLAQSMLALAVNMERQAHQNPEECSMLRSYASNLVFELEMHGETRPDLLPGYSEDDRKAWVDFKGWRFRAPWRCMCCGKAISLRQFCFGRCCGPCDCGQCRDHSTNRRESYSGPRELIDGKAADGFIESTAWRNSHEGLLYHKDDETFVENEASSRRLQEKWAAELKGS